MAGAAGTSLNLTFNASQTIEFSHETVMTDGSAFPFASYSLSFGLAGDVCGRALSFDQTDANGRLQIADDNSGYTVSIPARTLRPDTYTYEVNATEALTGKVIPILDGSITIFEEIY